MTEYYYRIEFKNGTHTKWTWNKRDLLIQLEENKDNPEYEGAKITYYEGRTYF